MRNLLLVLCCFVFGCGSGSQTDVPVPVTKSLSNINVTQKYTLDQSTGTSIFSGVSIVISGKNIHGIDFILDGIDPLFVFNRQVTVNTDIQMVVCATTSTTELHISAIDLQSMDGKSIFIVGKKIGDLKIRVISAVDTDLSVIPNSLSIAYIL